jgi:signal transduction histidine kinase
VEGLYFYGFAWATWIITTFLLKKKSKTRLPIACFILLAIIISPYTIKFQDTSVSYISIFMMLVTFIRIGYFTLRKKLYFFLTSLIISIGYGTFLLFELFDPIWIIFKREWMLALLITYLAVLLQEKLAWRISTVIIGCIYGDIIYAVIIQRFSFPYSIGSMSFLDVCSLASIMLFGWEGIKMTISYLESLYHAEEREKQKTT